MKIEFSQSLRPEFALSKSGHIMPLVYSHGEDGKDDTAIVFIHGFRANAMGTWGLGVDGYFWPVELGIDTKSSVYCFQYLNGVTSTGERAPLDITQVLRSLTNLLHQVSAKHRNVVFVTHSFGGIVLKALFVYLLHHEKDPGLREIIHLLRGACMISTPNHGSLFALIPGLFLRPFAAPNLKLLFPKSTYLRELHTSFLVSQKAQKQNMVCKTVGEQGRVMFVFRVPEKHAQLSEEFDHRVDERNHIKICWALEKSDELYKWILAFVLERQMHGPVRTPIHI